MNSTGLNKYRDKRVESLVEIGGIEDSFLGAHESVTKLWAAWKKDKTKIDTRFANLLISVLILSQKLGVENLDEILELRLKDLKK